MLASPGKIILDLSCMTLRKTSSELNLSMRKNAVIREEFPLQ